MDKDNMTNNKPSRSNKITTHNIQRSSDEPLQMEKVASLDTTPLLNLFRDDSECYRMLSNLMDETHSHSEDYFTADHERSQEENAPSPALSYSATSNGICVSSFPDQIGSFNPGSLIAAGRCDPAGHSLAAAESSAGTDPLALPKVSLNLNGVKSEDSPIPQVVSFSQAEVRQNAFFFIVSRGGMVLEQPGNRRMRRIINMYAQEYIQTRRLNRGALKHQVYDLCKGQFEFVIQKQAFMRYYERDVQKSGRRQLSPGRIQSILEANGGLAPIMSCQNTDFIRVGEDCALDVVGHLLRDAANELRRSQRSNQQNQS